MNLARLTPETGVSPLLGLRLPGRRLLLPCLFSLRAQLPAPALATTGRAHRVPSVALHADHLEESTSLGLGKAGHCRGEPAAAYEGFASGTLLPGKRSFAISVVRLRNASVTFCPLFADVRRYVQPKVLAISASSATPNCASAVRSALFATSTTGTLPATPSTASIHPVRTGNVLRRVKSATARIPCAPLKNESPSSCRNPTCPMMSHIAMWTCACRSGTSTRIVFFSTFAPRVRMYLSSNWSRTYRRMRDDFPTPRSPTRQIFDLSR